MYVFVCVEYRVCGRAEWFPFLCSPKLQNSCATAWEENEVPLEMKWPEKGKVELVPLGDLHLPLREGPFLLEM